MKIYSNKAHAQSERSLTSGYRRRGIGKLAGLSMVGIVGLHAHAAWSQSAVTLYGVIDEAIRYDNHQTRDGGHNPPAS